jgi:hypothetical protein
MPFKSESLSVVARSLIIQPVMLLDGLSSVHVSPLFLKHFIAAFFLSAVTLMTGTPTPLSSSS